MPAFWTRTARRSPAFTPPEQTWRASWAAITPPAASTSARAPPELIRVAARHGFDAVGLRLIRVTDTTPGYPLMTDAALMRATKDALHDTGLQVHDIEFVKITPQTDPAALAPFLDAGAELGAREVVTAPYDDDLARLADQIKQVLQGIAAGGGS